MSGQPEGRYTYSTAIRAGFEYLLDNHPEVFVIGQGLWSPWYVGDTMTDFDKKYGTARIIDTPVSESACTGAAVGAALAGMRPIVVHPRMDFMLYAMDAIVNQAAKWSHMVGGQASAGVTVRGIINRGGEQGAQHSQALHAWFAHVPGLRVVMPATVADARDLLIASVLSPDPVLYIDDRWLYAQSDDLGPANPVDLKSQGPKILRPGDDITLVGSGHTTQLATEAAQMLMQQGIAAEVVDLRVLNPFDPTVVVDSVRRTGRLLAVDGGWRNAGFAAEVIASVTERLDPSVLHAPPARVTLPDAPAPGTIELERRYYPTAQTLVDAAVRSLNSASLV